MFKHVTAPTPDPRDISPDVPESVVAILRRAMESRQPIATRAPTRMRQALETVLATMTTKRFVFWWSTNRRC